MEQQSKALPPALAMLSSERPRNVGWFSAGGMLFGDWGTSRLYVLGIAFLVAGRTSFWLILMMSLQAHARRHEDFVFLPVWHTQIQW